VGIKLSPVYYSRLDKLSEKVTDSITTTRRLPELKSSGRMIADTEMLQSTENKIALVEYIQGRINREKLDWIFS